MPVRAENTFHSEPFACHSDPAAAGEESPQFAQGKLREESGPVRGGANQCEIPLPRLRDRNDSHC